MKSLFLIIFSVLFLSSPSAQAWDKWGHFIVGSTAARILGEQGFPAMKAHSFDMGYYNNVPDLVWKAPETYKQELPQHFMDLEIFRKAMGSDTAWQESRAEFFKKYPSIQEMAGRGYWRVLEFSKTLAQLNQEMQNLQKQEKWDLEKYQELQLQWLSLGGELGHYVADMAQPFHCTEDYDGVKHGQKGIHAFFEGRVVDEIYPELIAEVAKQANRQWQSFTKKHASMSVLNLLRELCENSNSEVPKLLAMDKKIGRKSAQQVAPRYKKYLVERLSLGALYLSEIWRRELGWKYQGEKFFLFDAKPEFVRPE